MNEIEKTKAENLPCVKDDGEFALYLDKDRFEHAWRIGNLFAKSDLVPTQYKGKPENCMLAFNMASRLHIDPIMFMQKTYIIQGRPGLEAQLVIALVNARGPFTGPIRWTFTGEGKDRGCTAWAIHKSDNKVCAATITWKMVEMEGWSKKAGTKWLTIPDQMFQYRSATFLARLYCPEVILGFPTADELSDIQQPVEQTGQPAPVSAMEDRLAAKQVVNESEPVEPYPQSAKEAVTPVVKRGRKPKAQPIDDLPTEVEFNGQNSELEREMEIEKEDIPFGDIIPDPASKIRPEERFVCTTCDSVFPSPIGAAKNKCPHCFDLTIIDRTQPGA